MRTLLMGVLAATLVGCSYPLRPLESTEACTDSNGFGAAASRPIEPTPASFKTSSAPTRVKSAAKTEEPSTAHVRDGPHLAAKKSMPTVIEAKVEAPASSRHRMLRADESRLLGYRAVLSQLSRMPCRREPAVLLVPIRGGTLVAPEPRSIPGYPGRTDPARDLPDQRREERGTPPHGFGPADAAPGHVTQCSS